MKFKGIIILLLLFHALLFGYIVYKLDRDHQELEAKYGFSEELSRQIRKIEYTSESRAYSPIFYVGKDTIHPVTYSGKYPILICSFSVQSCAPCYETMLESVKEIFPDYEKQDNIIFLSNDLEYRYRDKFYGKKIYSNAVDNSLDITKEGAPFFLVVDQNLKTDFVKYSDKSNPQAIKDYLTAIKEYLYKIP